MAVFSKPSNGSRSNYYGCKSKKQNKKHLIPVVYRYWFSCRNIYFKCDTSDAQRVASYSTSDRPFTPNRREPCSSPSPRPVDLIEQTCGRKHRKKASTQQTQGGMENKRHFSKNEGTLLFSTYQVRAVNSQNLEPNLGSC